MKKFLKKVIKNPLFNIILDGLVITFYSFFVGVCAQTLFGIDAVNVAAFVSLILFWFPGHSVKSYAFPEFRDKKDGEKNNPKT